MSNSRYATREELDELRERLADIEAENLLERVDTLEDEMEGAKGAFAKIVDVLVVNDIVAVNANGRLVSQSKTSNVKRIAAKSSAAAETKSSKPLMGEGNERAKDVKVLTMHGLKYFNWLEETDTYSGHYLVLVSGTLTPSDIEALLLVFPVSPGGWSKVNSGVAITKRELRKSLDVKRGFVGYPDSVSYWVAPGDQMENQDVVNRLYYAFDRSRGGGAAATMARFLKTLPEYRKGKIEVPQLATLKKYHADTDNSKIPSDVRAAVDAKAEVITKEERRSTTYNPWME